MNGLYTDLKLNDEYLEKKFGNVEIYYLKLFAILSIPMITLIEIYTVHFIYQLAQFI